MLTSWSKIVRRWFLGIMAVVLVGSLVVWFWTRDTLPGTIRIVAGQSGGMYHQYATALKGQLETRHRHVTLDATRGSVENAERLRLRTADLGFVQGGAVPLEGVAVIAPLTVEVVHLIARRESGIHSVATLRGKRVSLGLPDSGMRATALQILGHYRLKEPDLHIENV